MRSGGNGFKKGGVRLKADNGKVKVRSGVHY